MIDPQQTVSNVVLDHSECAPVFQQHRIDYCCRGSLTVADACRDRGLELGGVITDLERAIAERRGDQDDPRTLSNAALVAHVISRYHEPLRRQLPFLRTLAAKVARVHGEHNPRLGELAEIVAQLGEDLEPHLDDEEATLFPAAMAARPELPRLRELLAAMRDEHLAVAALLERMHAATEEYTVPDWACTSYRTLFRELQQLETDILRHVHLENHVLAPRFGLS
jgi:regulator of cell morphogenesis and NO signaling